MQEAQEKRISNPERIQRILGKLCDARFSVLIRSVEHPATAVRGKIQKIGPAKLTDNRVAQSIYLTGVSSKGYLYLVDKKRLQIEFILASRKVTFQCRLLKVRQDQCIFITLPKELVSLERRSNARFKLSRNVPAFISFDNWKPSRIEAAMMPVFSHYNDLRMRIPLADVSLGGVCAYTPFPAIQTYATGNLRESRARLFLPMQEPVWTRLEVRWVKVTKETYKDSDFEEKTTEMFRIGCEFDSSPKLELGIKQLIAKITQQDAI